MTATILHREYDRLKREATTWAGGLTKLSQRATVYRQIFLESRGNHAFPLIAAHGALWAGGYFRFGMALGSALSWQYALRPEFRRTQLYDVLPNQFFAAPACYFREFRESILATG